MLLNKAMFPTFSLPPRYSYSTASLKAFLGGMKLQHLCECVKGTEHTFNKINITSTNIVESQVWSFICYYNTLVESKSVENILFKQCYFPSEK